MNLEEGISQNDFIKYRKEQKEKLKNEEITKKEYKQLIDDAKKLIVKHEGVLEVKNKVVLLLIEKGFSKNHISKLLHLSIKNIDNIKEQDEFKKWKEAKNNGILE